MEVPVNPGEVATTPDEAAAITARFGGPVAIKAQVHTGGRGKAGGIKLAINEEAALPDQQTNSRHGYRGTRRQ